MKAHATRSHTASSQQAAAQPSRATAKSAGPSNHAHQAEVTAGPEEDSLEREADQAAERVMTGADVRVSGRASAGAQRKCDACQSDVSGQSGSGAQVAADAVRSGGRSLSPGQRAYFEPRFGRDFSGVRVHDHSEAASGARTIGARAYTLDSDIAFAAGAYAPESREGRRLLAHELAHVVQQGEGAEPVIRRDICTPKERTGEGAGKEQLTPEELESRRQGVREAIERAREPYPLASANLEHWLNGSGAPRRVSQSDFDFAREETGLPEFLREVHRACIAGEREADCGNPSSGIQGRLDKKHADTLQPPGTQRTLTWQDSLRADIAERSGFEIIVNDPVERDMAIALGGYTVSSHVTLHLEEVASGERSGGLFGGGGKDLVAKVDSWQVQVCDRYDWIAGAPAVLPVPQGVDVGTLPLPEGAGRIEENIMGTGLSVVIVNDDWFADVQKAGGAKEFVFYSEIFEAPASVKADFPIVEGRVQQ